jgi:hypothetical protein
MAPCSAYSVSQRSAASSSMQCLVAPAASTGRGTFRSNSWRTRHAERLRPSAAAAVEVHPLHADVAAYYADYAGTSSVLTQSQPSQQQHGERSIYPNACINCLKATRVDMLLETAVACRGGSHMLIILRSTTLQLSRCTWRCIIRPVLAASWQL